MVVITLQRNKCIGCNYCVELAPQRWCMSKKDGKSVLLGSENKKGFHTIKVENKEFESNQNAQTACPVKIIKVKQL